MGTKSRNLTTLAAALGLAMFAAEASAHEFYVAPDGTAAGDGSLGKPWDLDTALAQPGAVQPGDTLWLRGGRYVGKPYIVHGEVHRTPWMSQLTGDLGKGVDDPGGKIQVKAYPGERVTLDGENTNGENIFVAGGAYTWFWDVEIMSSSAATNRTTATSGSAPPGCHDDSGVPYPDGIRYGSAISVGNDYPVTHPGLKFINVVVHDAAGGFGAWRGAYDFEVYGALLYYNGWSAPDRGHGHGVYSQNWPDTGTKRYRDLIIFQNFDNGIQCYGSDQAYIDNHVIVENTIFQAGRIDGQDGNLIELGGGNTAHNPVLKDNVAYAATTGNCDLGYGPAGTEDMVLERNYIATGNAWPILLYSPTGATITENTFRGLDCSGGCGYEPATYPGNTNYLSDGTAPIPQTPDATFVRVNEYDPHRVTITVLNWSHAATASVDLKGSVPAGAAYELRDAQNFFGPPVATGVYTSGPLEVPMSGLAPAAPLGWATPEATAPEFNAFVLLFEPPAASGGGGAGGGAVESGVDAGSDGTMLSSENGGCGCRVDATSAPTGALPLLALAWLASWRRRRRSSSVPWRALLLGVVGAGCGGSPAAAPDGAGGATSGTTVGTANHASSASGTGGGPACGTTAAGHEFFVSPDGMPAGDGSIGAPWDLATALAQPEAVMPGDTLWLRGGTYVGHFVSRLVGTAEAPITVRNYRGERATIDGGVGGDVVTMLSVAGAYTRYWGIEIMSSDPVRWTDAPGSSPDGIYRGGGIDTNTAALGGADHVKFINLVIHDTFGSVGAWGSPGEGLDTEVNGCLLYYDGWDAPDRGHGHPVYANDTPPSTLLIKNNILFRAFSTGLHAYTQAGELDDITVAGNIVFENGTLSADGVPDANILFGASTEGNVATSPKVLDNATYVSDFGCCEGTQNFGYAGGWFNGTITGNYFVGPTRFVDALSSLTLGGPGPLHNELYGYPSAYEHGVQALVGAAAFASAYPDNVWSEALPVGGTKVLVYPNDYELGRCNVAIYDWTGTAAPVGVDLSQCGLREGQGYTIQNAQNFYGPPVGTGTFTASSPSADFPVSGFDNAPAIGFREDGTTPIGAPAPSSIFNAYVVLPVCSSPAWCC